MTHLFNILAVLLGANILGVIVVQAVKTRSLEKNDRYRTLEATKILLWSLLWLVLSIALAWVAHAATGKKANAVVSGNIVIAMFTLITVGIIMWILILGGQLKTSYKTLR